MKTLLRSVVLPLFAFCFVVTPAFAVTIYGTAYNGSGDRLATLYTVDPNTGAAIPIGPTGFTRVSAIDFNPLTGVLYGVGVDAQDNATLISINTTTGMGTAIGLLGNGLGSSGNSVTISDMSFRSDGVLYAVSSNITSPTVYTIDLMSGAATPLGSNTTGRLYQGNALAFDTANSLFFLSTDQNNPGAGGEVDLVNQTNGMFTPTGTTVNYPVDLLDPRTNAMDYDVTTGILYASVVHGTATGGVTNFIAQIDLATGVVSNPQATIRGLDGLAVLPMQNGTAVPDTGSTLLLALPLLLGLVLLKRPHCSTASLQA